MSAYRYDLMLLCPNGHETSTELLRAEPQEDGTVSGFAGSDADFCAVCGAEPKVLGVTASPETRCQWYAACDNEATTTRPHPVLGDVPLCARCARVADALSA